MAYIGTKPTIGNFQICDAISVVNGQAAYTMQVGSVNVIPQSANHMIVSLNGTIQKPGSSFTVSGSTITFASNLATGDVIDFIQILGDVLDLGVPSDATCTTAKLADDAVTAAKINNDIISGSTELASEPADTDEFLVSDSGTLKRIDYSLIKGGGITMADQFRLSADVGASSQSVDFTSNLERVDTSGQGTLGSSLMSESSGIFTFPSTGIYLVRFDLVSYVATATRYLNAHIMLTTNNSSYSIIAEGRNGGFVSESSSTNNQANAITLLDITDTSNQKVKFQAVINQTSSNGFYGSSTLNRTTMTFIRLGDT